VTEIAARDLAPMIQDDLIFDDELIESVRGYCAPLKEVGIDTLILGCTHYPLIAPAIQRILGRDVRLVMAGHAIAGAIQRELAARDALEVGGTEGDYRFLVTGDVGDFTRDGTRFLQLPLAGRVEAVSV
jgi:glutamate racemase